MKLLNALGISILCITAFSACKEQTKNEKEILPSSTGELSEIVVIYDKARSTDKFKDEVQEIFGQEVGGLYPPEQKFRVLFTDETFFKGYFKLHHNVFVLLNEENLGKLIKTYGENNSAKIQEIINKDGALGFNKSEVWASNQNVFYITAKDQASMMQKMKDRATELVEIATEHERNSGLHMVFNLNIAKDSFYQQQLKTKNYAIRKPDSYRTAVDLANFCWLRKESSKYDYGILMYDVKYTSQSQFSLDSIVALRNRITKKHIPGELDGSYMKVSSAIPLVHQEVNLNDLYAVQVRGLWEVEGDFMGGPFISYVVYDEKRQRLVVVEGFVYGPNKSKVKPLREIELILNSLSIK